MAKGAICAFSAIFQPNPCLPADLASSLCDYDSDVYDGDMKDRDSLKSDEYALNVQTLFRAWAFSGVGCRMVSTSVR